MAIGAPPCPKTDGLSDSAMVGSGAALEERWYVGERSPAGCRVVVVEGSNVYPLRARTHDPLWSFSWGRSGSSARELAWSILYDSAHDLGLAHDWCSAFTSEVISLLRRDAFQIAAQDVIAWLSDEQLAGATDRLLRRAMSRSLAGGRPVHRQSAVKRCDSDSHLAIGREDYRVICRARSHELMRG
jgi:hypothetical protein